MRHRAGNIWPPMSSSIFIRLAALMRLGNLFLRKGSGTPRRVVACALDRPGFAVSEITDAGLSAIARKQEALRQHPLWIQFHEGQRIRVLTRGQSVGGVVTVKSTHLQRGAQLMLQSLHWMMLWVDVGAHSRIEVQAFRHSYVRFPWCATYRHFRMPILWLALLPVCELVCAAVASAGTRAGDNRRDDLSAHDIAQLRA